MLEQTDLPFKPSLLSILKNEKNILDIGSSYLNANPAERNLKRLQGKLYARPGMGMPGSENELGNLIRNDFTVGNTSQLNGWILSITEARECALFALLHS